MPVHLLQPIALPCSGSAGKITYQYRNDARSRLILVSTSDGIGQHACEAVGKILTGSNLIQRSR